MAIVDASGDVENGYTYDVYGEPTVTGSLGNEFDFAGQQTDPSTGLQYLRARYYDPVSGTFMSRDPLAASPEWLQHPFGYASASPALRIDPSGLDSPNPFSDWVDRLHPCKVGGYVVSRLCADAASVRDYIKSEIERLTTLIGEALDCARQAGKSVLDFLNEHRAEIKQLATIVLVAGVSACIGAAIISAGAPIGLCIAGARTLAVVAAWDVSKELTDEDLSTKEKLLRSTTTLGTYVPFGGPAVAAIADILNWLAHPETAQ